MTREGRPRRRAPESYVSLFLKYLMFFMNFAIWLVGGAMVSIGLWAFLDKYNSLGAVQIQNAFDIILDLSMVLMVVGGIVFIISMAGCIGALRENTCLLSFYSVTITIIFFGEIALAIVAFVFPDKFLTEVKQSLSHEAVEKYRDDDNLRNLIDYVQLQFSCCGISDEGYLDWTNNAYFNCTELNKSVESCGVPFSCCRNSTNISNGLINIMCGFRTQSQGFNEANKHIFTEGCITTIHHSALRNLHTIAYVAIGVAVAQIIVLYLSKNLHGQIEMQKARASIQSRY